VAGVYRPSAKDKDDKKESKKDDKKESKKEETKK